MSNKERASYWRNQIEQWQASGLSGAQFCQDNGIHLKPFYYWSRKCSRKTIQAVISVSKFLAVEVLNASLSYA